MRFVMESKAGKTKKKEEFYVTKSRKQVKLA